MNRFLLSLSIFAFVSCGGQSSGLSLGGTKATKETPAPVPTPPTGNPNPAPAPIDQPKDVPPVPSVPVETPKAPVDQPAPAPTPQPTVCHPAMGCIPGVNGGGVVTVPVPVFTSIPVSGIQDCYRVSLAVCEIENEAVAAINDYRTARGLMPLFPSFQIGWAGRQWSDEMAHAGIVSEADPATFVDLMNLQFGPANVIIGNGNGGGWLADISVVSIPYTDLNTITGDAILNALFADSMNRADVLFPGVRALGVGIVLQDGRAWVTVLWST